MKYWAVYGSLFLSCLAIIVQANPFASGFEIQSQDESYGFDLNSEVEFEIPDHEIEDEVVEEDEGPDVEEIEYERPPHRRPHHPPHHHDSSDKTIYQILSKIPRFSRILKAIDFDNATAVLLNDSSASVTLFVPDNDSLPRRPDRRKGFTPHDYSLSSIVDDIESPEEGVDDDADKKKLIKAIVHAILTYHVLPQSLDSHQLGENSTYATALKARDGSLGGAARRIQVFPSVFKRGGVVNLYAKIKKADIKAKNGIIHVINHPLIPPLSILEETFLVPDALSIWTSSLQKVNLADATEYRVLPKRFGIANKTAAPAITTFIPVNSAWRRLPKGLQLFLFSPFGERALKKLLQFHIVPNFVYHSDWTYNASASASVDWKGQSEDEMMSLPGISADNVNTRIWNEDQEFNGLRHQFHGMEGFVNLACSMGHLPSSLPPELTAHDFPIPKLPHELPSGIPKLPDLPTSIPKPPHLPVPERPKRPHPPHRRPHPPHHKAPKLLVNSTVVLPTLLANHSITVHLTRVESRWLPPSLTTKVRANGVPVVLADGVARNGAVHIIRRVLNPLARPGRGHRRPHRPHHPHEAEDEEMDTQDEYWVDEWEDWKDWLPQWAAED